MRFRNLTNNNDWDFGRGLQSYASDADAIALNVKTRLQSWIGDCFFDMVTGIDWQNRLARFGQEPYLREELQKLILETDGVLSIESISTSMEGRSLIAQYTINTIYSRSASDSVQIGA